VFLLIINPYILFVQNPGPPNGGQKEDLLRFPHLEEGLPAETFRSLLFQMAINGNKRQSTSPVLVFADIPLFPGEKKLLAILTDLAITL